MRGPKRVAGTLLTVFAVGILLAMPIAADAAKSKADRGPKLSVRLKTGGQAKALRTNQLKVRVVARRAATVRVKAKTGVGECRRRRKGARGKCLRRIAKPKTVRLKSRKARVVSLRLNKRGRRILARC